MPRRSKNRQPVAVVPSPARITSLAYRASHPSLAIGGTSACRPFDRAVVANTLDSSDRGSDRISAKTFGACVEEAGLRSAMRVTRRWPACATDANQTTSSSPPFSQKGKVICALKS